MPKLKYKKSLAQLVEEKTLTCFNDECWIWTSSHDMDGYPQVSYEGKLVYVYALSYTIRYYDVDETLELSNYDYQFDHLCLTRACYNPKHIERVTVAENNRRKNALITHCKYGHPLDQVTSQGRKCGSCNRVNSLGAYYAKRIQAYRNS